MNLGSRQALINRTAKASSSTKGSNNGRSASYRSYCPTCPINHTDPERSSHVAVDANTRYVTGSCKHTWRVGSYCTTGTELPLATDVAPPGDTEVLEVLG